MLRRPPAFAALYTLLGLGLSWCIDAPRLLPGLLASFAFIPAVLGFCLASWALLTFRRAGTTHHPYAQTTALVTTGPYRVTRNPMYLSVTLVLAGIAIWVGAWPMMLVPVAFFATVACFVVPGEETRLATWFPEVYPAYRARVRRWL